MKCNTGKTLLIEQPSKAESEEPSQRRSFEQ
jgi:hypothetical protein